MNKFYNQNKQLLSYLLKFGAGFTLLYFGTLGIIGLSTPQNQYSPFVANYLDFISPLRASLINSSKFVLSIFGYNAIVKDDFTLAMSSGESIRMVYSCIGYGIMSFWMAFIFANNGSLQKKSGWMIGGLLVLWLLNVARICLLLIAIKNQWQIPLGLDHHTLFNIVTYGAIFGMIYFYDKSFGLKPVRANKHLPSFE